MLAGRRSVRFSRVKWSAVSHESTAEFRSTRKQRAPICLYATVAGYGADRTKVHVKIENGAQVAPRSRGGAGQRRRCEMGATAGSLMAFHHRKWEVPCSPCSKLVRGFLVDVGPAQMKNSKRRVFPASTGRSTVAGSKTSRQRRPATIAGEGTRIMGIGVSRGGRPGTLVALIRDSRLRWTFQIQVNLRVRLGPNEKALQVRKRLLPQPAPQVGQETVHQGSWIFLFRALEV